jgi:cytochrome c
MFMCFRFFVVLAILWLISAPASAETIHDYAKRGDVIGIAAALDAGTDVNDYDGLGTPLTHAVKKGHFAAAKLLIARGANVNISTMYYGEPIMLATRQIRVDLVELLLNHGAIPDSTLDGQPVLNLAVALGCFGCVKALVEAGADVNWTSTSCTLTRSALGIANFYGFDDIAAYLRAHGARDSTWTAQR